MQPQALAIFCAYKISIWEEYGFISLPGGFDYMTQARESGS